MGKKILEVCSSSDWILRHVLNRETIRRDWRYEAAKFFNQLVWRCLLDADESYEPFLTAGVRATYRGWEDAKFAFRIGPVASFVRLTRKDNAIIYRVIEKAREETETVFPKQAVASVW